MNWPVLNQDYDAIEELITSPVTIMGLADAGAHATQIMDASQPTYFLSHWVRDRGVLSLEEGVRRLTSDTAGFIGYRDRGVVREGAFADLNVIDLDAHVAAGARDRAATSPAARPASCSGAAGSTTPSSTVSRSWRPASTPARWPAASSAAPTEPSPTSCDLNARVYTSHEVAGGG